MTLEEKWGKVKKFYEGAGYKDKEGRPLKFRRELKECEIEWLYLQMTKLQQEIHDWYFYNPWAAPRMRRVIEDPKLINKRGQFE